LGSRSVVSRAIDTNARSAHAKAVQQLAQKLGTNKLPPGIESRTEEKRMGVYATTLIYDPQNTGHAQQTAQQMQQPY